MIDTWLHLSIPGSCVPPSQRTAQNSSHHPFLKNHATDQLVHGHVSWWCGVTPNYPPEGLVDGVMLEILDMRQQVMDYLSQISSKKPNQFVLLKIISLNSLA